MHSLRGPANLERTDGLRWELCSRSWQTHGRYVNALPTLAMYNPLWLTATRGSTDTALMAKS